VARGWESKAIESQQEEAERQRQVARAPALTPAERARLERRRTLELARAKTEAELRAATRPAHREMLERAKAAIDEQLSEIQPRPKNG
jgi:hypothetical protein